MKNILRRLINGIMSIITTLLIMASPVAAIVYAAEPMATNGGYAVMNVSTDQADQKDRVKTDWVQKKVEELKPDLLDDSIETTFLPMKK